tara:strand:+ start:324 stop:935 length:612 start_codon:yes stop_codon:yes gene_type:complete
MSDDRLVIDVIDNGGQWTHREWRMLRYLDVDTQILSNTTPLDELRELDGLVLSGGAARVGLTGELGNCAAYLGLDIPILGICAGHQFMAGFYGGRAREAPKPEFGAATIELLGGGGPLFAETPTSQTVWESHNDEVIEAPPGFRVTASSESCGVKRWRTNHKIASASNSIQKSTIRSTARRFSRTLWKSAVGLARALFAQGAG